MGTLKSFSVGKAKKEEYLHINPSSKRIKSCTKMLVYTDKDTKQKVLYVPSLEITSYGETKKKALEMLKFSINEFCDYLMSLPIKKMEAELTKLGWKHDKFKNKEYSKAFVDFKGNLKEFNAIDDLVEEEVLAL